MAPRTLGAFSLVPVPVPVPVPGCLFSPPALWLGLQMTFKRIAPLLVALGIGMVAVVHLPLIDDEANAIVLALRGKAAILQAGLGGTFIRG